MTTPAQQRKFLINCTHGENDLERATVSFILALSCATHNAETAVFTTADAAKLCVKGGTDNLVAEGYEPIYGLVEEFIENGGKIWLCPVCAKAKGITTYAKVLKLPAHRAQWTSWSVAHICYSNSRLNETTGNQV